MKNGVAFIVKQPEETQCTYAFMHLCIYHWSKMHLQNKTMVNFPIFLTRGSDLGSNGTKGSSHSGLKNEELQATGLVHFIESHENSYYFRLWLIIFLFLYSFEGFLMQCRFCLGTLSCISWMLVALYKVHFTIILNNSKEIH